VAALAHHLTEGLNMNTSFAGRAPRLWALLLAVAGAFVLCLPASALASPLDCSGATIYSLASSGSVNSVYALQAATLGNSSVTAAAVTTLPAGSAANGLGVTGNGSGLYATQGSSTSASAEIWGYSASAGTWTSYTGTGTGSSSTSYVAGAVDPRNGVYYYARYAAGTSSSPGTATVYGFNTATNTAISGIIATFSLPSGNGSSSESGDFTFDQSGNLYVLANQLSTRGLGVVKNIPTTGSVAGVTLTDTTLSSVTDPSSYNGIAFDSDGSLYLESSSGSTIQIRSVSPNNGALAGGPTAVSATELGTADDLASCASIPILSAGSNVSGRVGTGDQFTVSITGGTITTGNTATTTGSSTGAQTQSAGPVIASPGTAYTISEVSAGGSLSDYDVSYACVDTANGNTPVTSGTGASFQLTYPSTSSPSVVCTFATSPQADVALSDVSSSSSVPAGGGFTYTLTATNNGPGAATNVDLADALPSGVTIQSVSASQGSCATTSGLSCNLGTINSGDSATVTVTAHAASGASAGPVSDNASVAADQPDPDGSNNAVSEPVTIEAAADVALTDTTSSVTARVGGRYTYTLTATNNGPDAATNVALTETVPAGATITSTSASQGSCATAAGVSCQLGTIASGDSATVTLTVQAPATIQTPASDNAAVTADQVDPDSSNNTTSAQITITQITQTTPITPTTLSAGPPVNQIAPSIAGTPAIGQILEANVGGWSGSGVTYGYQWLRDGIAIPDATGADYRVRIADVRHRLSVEVVASDGTTSVDAASQTVAALAVDIGGCTAPSGRLGASAVGGVRLGMTRAAARRLVASTQRLNGYTDNLCLAGGYGIRVGYANATILGHGTPPRRSLSSRVVFATSANPYYALNGVRPGTPVATVAKRLHLTRAIHIGPNTWYVIPGTTTNHVLKTRAGVIQEVGVLNRALTRTRDQQGRLLRRF
jgi:uncharacterized repeat protein (TIGR01451 family)